MFCIYKTDPSWIKALRKLSPDIQANFWRKGTSSLNIPIGSWLYFNQRRTRNIVGRGILVNYEVLSIGDAWGKYGVGNGVYSLAELESKATDILGVTGKNSEIGCIVLSELQFLTEGKEFFISRDDYPSQIVGPKYFNDNQLLELAASFSNPIFKLEQKRYFEGEASFSYRIGYERNQDARLACLAHYGYTCQACKTNLQDVYGEIAREFIHVHHQSKISEAGGVREVDPVNDLVPLCPNCHSMAHRREPPFSVEELRKFIAEVSKP